MNLMGKKGKNGEKIKETRKNKGLVVKAKVEEITYCPFRAEIF